MIILVILTVIITVPTLIHSLSTNYPVATPMFGAYLFVMKATDYSNFNSQSTTTITFYQPRTGITISDTAVTLAGMQNKLQSFCGFKITVSSVATTNAVVNLNVESGSSIGMLSFTLIVIDSKTYQSYIQIVFIQQNDFLNSTSSGVASISFRGKSISFKNNFGYGSFLSYFTLKQNNATNSLQVAIDSQHTTDSGSIDYKFTVYKGTQISRIGITLFIYSDYIKTNYPTYSVYPLKYETYANNIAYANNNYTAGNGYLYGYQDKCLIAHKSLVFDQSFTLKIWMSSQNQNYSSTTSNLQMYMFCLMMDFNCATIDTYCLKCKSRTICTECVSNYAPVVYPNLSSSCQPCSASVNANSSFCNSCQTPNNTLVSGVCKPCNQSIINCIECSLSGCTKCTANYFLDSLSQCVTCSSSLFHCSACSITTVTNCQMCSLVTNINTVICATCQLGYYQFNSTTCKLCSQSIASCLECSNAYICNKCVSGYVFHAASLKCETCLNLWPYCSTCNASSCITCFTGYVFWQGQCQKCNNSVGCIAFTVDSSGNLVCSTCDTTQFLAMPVNNSCVCKAGILQNGVCTTDIGCVNAYMNNNVVSCRFCNFAANYLPTPVNGVCQCLPHYALNQYSICDDLCGDGRIMIDSSLYCDDGNLISGDGCSSTCSIQVGYRCENGSKSNPSACYYIGIKPTLALKNVQRVSGSNSGLFQFSLSPPLINIASLVLSNYVMLVCAQAQYSISNVSYEKGSLKVQVDFLTDLQGRYCSLTLSFDKKYVSYKNSTLSYKAVSRNIPLVISNRIDQYQRINFIFNILSYMILGTMALSLSHKMIGAELLFSNQIIYISNCFNQQSTFIMSGLKSFNLVTGGWSFFHQSSDQNIMYPFSNRLDIGRRFFQTNFFVISSLLILSLICIIFVSYSFLTNDSQKSKKCSKMLVKIYRYLLFPITAGFMLVLQICLYFSNYRSSVQSTTIVSSLANSALLCLSLLVMAIIFVIQLDFSLFKNQQKNKKLGGLKQCKSWYISLFLFRTIFLSVVIAIGTKIGFKVLLILINAMQVVYLTVLVLSIPYKRVIHNVGLFFCEIPVLFMLVLSLVREYLFIQQLTEIFLMFILQGLIIVGCLLSFARTLVETIPKLQKCISTKKNCVKDTNQKININFKNIYNHQKEDNMKVDTERYRTIRYRGPEQTNFLQTKDNIMIPSHRMMQNYSSILPKQTNKNHNIISLEQEARLKETKQKLRQRLLKKKKDQKLKVSK